VASWIRSPVCLFLFLFRDLPSATSISGSLRIRVFPFEGTAALNEVVLPTNLQGDDR
jgi:hypothetical protein